MTPPFLTFAKYYSEEEARELIGILEKHKIPFTIEHEKELLDKIYIGSSLDPLVAIKIRETDFKAVNELMKSETRIDLSVINKEYYLFQFTNEELIEVLNKPSEWNYFDMAVAQKILEERQVKIPELKVPVNEPLFTPIKLKTFWLICEYIAAFAFNFVGIIIGVATLVATKTLNTGQRIKMFESSSRQHAIVILAIGVARFFYLVYNYFYYY